MGQLVATVKYSVAAASMCSTTLVSECVRISRDSKSINSAPVQLLWADCSEYRLATITCSTHSSVYISLALMKSCCIRTKMPRMRVSFRTFAVHDQSDKVLKKRNNKLLRKRNREKPSKIPSTWRYVSAFFSSCTTAVIQ